MELFRAVLQDLRYATRNLLRSRGLTLIAAITLTIGIGANTAIFSIIDAILLRPLPFEKPEQLLRLNETEAAPGHYPFAGPDFMDWKAQNRTFQDMALYSWPNELNFGGSGRPDHVTALPTSASFFSLLGVKPQIGRTWAAGEDQPGKNRLVVLSHGFWQSHFAGDAAVIGRSIELDARKYTVVGVMPAGFRYPMTVQMWTLLELDSKGLGERGSHWLQAIGRMKPGVTPARALADLKVIAARLEKDHPDSNHKVGAAVTPLHDDMVGRSRNSLFMMLTAVGLVLLIACANVANLLLSRAVSRQKEMAVRGALGAGRWRLIRQLLTESMVLSCTGGVLGLFVAWGIVKLVSTTESFRLPQFRPVDLNGEVLVFTFVLAVLTGLLFGLVPALRTSSPELLAELKGGAGSAISPGLRKRFTSNVLVAGEMALSMVLLVSAGLLLKDFAQVRSIDIGVDTERVLTASVALPDARYETPRQRYGFAQSLMEKARQIPGVSAVAMTSTLPLEGGSNYYVQLRGQSTGNQLVEYHRVSPDYFRVMGVKLRSGRLFNSVDVSGVLADNERYEKLTKDGAKLTDAQTDAMIAPVVINQAMAKHFWPKGEPLGQMFSQGSDHGPWRQVIGVVSDVRQLGLTEKPVPEAYDVYDGTMATTLVLRTPQDPASLTNAVQHALTEVDSTLPFYSVRTMSKVVAGQAAGQQFLSVLVGVFAAVAVLLAAIGIYGVLSYAVTRRTREIGIRMSLGASRALVLRQILFDGLKLALLGFLLGALGAYASGRVMASLLSEVKPGDPLVFAATAGVLGAVAMMACYLPARRAARLEPMAALRYE